ncbi:hypothetical protein [Roseomonas populi]|uniref:Uncharacterized protein n=1 Tax=Roseomonas populi TaxID=3121582 RepID=A0ABT1XD86_9PROT|nr:hypothetical protein [Roseomonas pecuniae]MCR0985082.1 hypothetical protein [Roseomonas pecuniae]
MRFDVRDAPGWRTEGDLHMSVLQVLPEPCPHVDETWTHLARAVAAETGADPRRVRPETLLLGVPLWDRVGRWLRRLTRR